MAIVVRQLASPRGRLGRLVGRTMARGHAAFNAWVVGQLEEWAQSSGAVVERVVELGPGPGVALEHVLRAFPTARVWGVEPSQVMLDQSRRRNLDCVRSGRLVLVHGDTAALADLAPVDIVFAVYVLPFWHRPQEELARVHAALRPGGALALGHELGEDLGRFWRERFLKEGHVFYDSDEELSQLLRAAGFRSVECRLADGRDRLALAIA